jgi:hypothetical protein
MTHPSLPQKVCSVRIKSWKASLGRSAEGRAALVETVVVVIVWLFPAQVAAQYTRYRCLVTPSRPYFAKTLSMIP